VLAVPNVPQVLLVDDGLELGPELHLHPT
jgi:hypothetical protein